MKYIIIIVLAFSSFILNAQNEDLLKIYTQIDTIIEKERQFYHTQVENKSQYIKQIKGYYYTYEPVYEWGKLIRQPLNRKYEKQVLKYLEKFKFDKMLNVRETAYQLIYSVGFYSKDLKIRQKALNHMLDMVYAVFRPWGNDIKHFKLEDFNKKAKKRLKEIIKNGRTKKDIKFDIEENMRLAKYSEGAGLQAEYISKRDSLPFKHVRDSILTARLNYIKNKLKTVNGYGDYYILLIGRLYMSNFVPELEKMLKRGRNKEDIKNIKLALARMGNEKYEQELLKKKDVWAKYINTQNSAWYKIKVLYENPPDFNCEPNYEEYEIDIEDVLVPEKYFIIQSVQNWILNFPEEYKLPKRIDICMKRHDFQAGKYEDKIENAKKWLKENKGKYELDKSVW